MLNKSAATSKLRSFVALLSTEFFKTKFFAFHDYSGDEGSLAKV